MLQLECNSVHFALYFSSGCRKASFSKERMAGMWDGSLALLNYFTLGVIQVSLVTTDPALAPSLVRFDKKRSGHVGEVASVRT